jgi:hypothetical protein
MVKKKPEGKPGRLDPKRNKSLAVRMVLGKMPNAKAADVVAAVKREYGHEIGQNVVYMIKTKMNMAADGRPRKSKSTPRDNPMTTPALWVEAIKGARQLLKATGSAANAIALLKALDGR